jgi:lipoate-protein ligase A
MAWRLIISPASDGPSHMALDEALLTSFIADPGSAPVIRVYAWSGPCRTIGYFQKYTDTASEGVPVTRRLTGGLTVSHGKDLSYAMIAGKTSWPWLYDQTETYRRMHGVIRKILSDMGFEVESAEVAVVPAGGVSCIKTVFSHDVLYQGEKVVGSCQRRRGETILLQGSIHIPSLIGRMREVGSGLVTHFSHLVGVTLGESALLKNEEILRRSLVPLYASEQWNKKF